MLGESVETLKKIFTDVLFCKVKLSKMASTKTNKIKKTDTSFDEQLFGIQNFIG